MHTIYIHTRTYTYIPTYVRTYVLTYLPTYLLTSLHTYRHTDIHVCVGLAIVSGRICIVEHLTKEVLFEMVLHLLVALPLLPNTDAASFCRFCSPCRTSIKRSSACCGDRCCGYLFTAKSCFPPFTTSHALARRCYAPSKEISRNFSVQACDGGPRVRPTTRPNGCTAGPRARPCARMLHRHGFLRAVHTLGRPRSFVAGPCRIMSGQQKHHFNTSQECRAVQAADSDWHRLPAAAYGLASCCSKSCTTFTSCQAPKWPHRWLETSLSPASSTS